MFPSKNNGEKAVKAKDHTTLVAALIAVGWTGLDADVARERALDPKR